MSTKVIHLQIQNKIQLLALFSCLVLSGCNNFNGSKLSKRTSEDSIVASDVRKDTLFRCLESHIKNQVWMGENLCVKTFCNGDSLYYANTFEQWQELTDKNMPVHFEVGINKKLYQQVIEGYSKKYYGRYDEFLTAPDTAYFVLYNRYAIVDERKLCPKGWRMPSKKDWDSLFKNVKNDKCLLDTIGVINTYGNKYAFSLRPTPYGFAHKKYDFNFDFAIFWSDLGEKILLCTMVSEDLNIRVFQSWYPSNKYDGCCVRCIKE